MKKQIAAFVFGIAVLLAVPQVASASQTVSSESTVMVDVTADIAGEYYVTIPKTIRIDSVSKTAGYTITVSGDIAGAERVEVVPEKEFLMLQEGKEEVSVTVNQDKTIWESTEFETTGRGVVSAEGLTSGKWQGSFSFAISLVSE